MYCAFSLVTLSQQCQHQTFLAAAEGGHVDIVQNCYDLLGPDILGYKDEDGYTALHRASYNGNVEVMEYLLMKGANIHACTNDGWQSLHCACRWNKVNAASVLLQNGACINSSTNGKLTPLHLAACNNIAKITLELLLTDSKINPCLYNNKGETAFDVACSFGCHGYLFEILDDCIVKTVE